MKKVSIVLITGVIAFCVLFQAGAKANSMWVMYAPPLGGSNPWWSGAFVTNVTNENDLTYTVEIYEQDGDIIYWTTNNVDAHSLDTYLFTDRLSASTLISSGTGVVGDSATFTIMYTGSVSQKSAYSISVRALTGPTQSGRTGMASLCPKVISDTSLSGYQTFSFPARTDEYIWTGVVFMVIPRTLFSSRTMPSSPSFSISFSVTDSAGTYSGTLSLTSCLFVDLLSNINSNYLNGTPTDSCLSCWGDFNGNGDYVLLGMVLMGDTSYTSLTSFPIKTCAGGID